MKFQEKYNSIEEETEKSDPSKLTISNEAFALGEMMQVIVNQLRANRNG